MRTGLPGVLCALSVVCGVPAYADAVEDFWYWFEHEHDALLAPATRQDREEALLYWLDRIAPGLSYEIGEDRRRSTLTFSADGDNSLFRQVELIVEGRRRSKAGNTSRCVRRPGS